MSKDIPIIFSGPMVRALLDGRKTMTRRLALTSRTLKEESGPGHYLSRTKIMPSPWQQVKPGDRLWVRENFLPMHSGDPSRGARYMADVGRDDTKWKPCIHMPRWASRLTLIVTGTKVERLQDISEEDAWSEGVCSFVESLERSGGWEGLADRDRRELVRVNFGSACKAFNCLFDQLHGPAVWDSNPEVVVLSFRVIKANIDGVDARAVA